MLEVEITGRGGSLLDARAGVLGGKRSGLTSEESREACRACAAASCLPRKSVDREASYRSVRQASSPGTAMSPRPGHDIIIASTFASLPSPYHGRPHRHVLAGIWDIAAVSLAVMQGRLPTKGSMSAYCTPAHCKGSSRQGGAGQARLLT